jgi:hypothetical protein
VWFGPAESPQPLISAVADERLETEPNGISIGPGPARRLGVSEQPLVDMEGFLHTYNCAIDVWPQGPSMVVNDSFQVEACRDGRRLTVGEIAGNDRCIRDLAS